MPKKLTQLTAATAVADADQLLIEQSGTSKRATRDLVAPLPLNYIAGLITSNNGTDSDHDIDIAAGVARDDTDVDNMRLTSPITKQIDAAWAVGTDQGGLDTGSVAASTMYAIWLIKRSDTGVVDVLFSTSFTSPTMPTNYDRKRLIAAIATDSGADIEGYIQRGDDFVYDGHIADVTDNTLTTLTFETGTLSVPPNSIAKAILYMDNSGGTDNDLRATVRHVGSAQVGSGFNYQLYLNSTATWDRASQNIEIQVDASRQMEYGAVFSTGTPTLRITTMGFKMITRRDP